MLQIGYLKSVYSSFGIKFTDNIQTTEYEEDIEISDDENTNKLHTMDPYLKRLYVRSNSEHHSRIKYFTRKDHEEKEYEEEDSKDGILTLIKTS